MKRPFAVALVHHPVLARDGAVVTTAVTNLDVHDIARTAHTYDAEAFFVVHPIEAQRELVRRIRDHWTEGSGARRIPDRKPPMESVRIVADLAEAKRTLGVETEVWVTTARSADEALSHQDAAARLREAGPPVLLVLGTGWGLAPEVMERSQQCLAPIRSPREDGYNHLSVRAAAAILLDRLCGHRLQPEADR